VSAGSGLTLMTPAELSVDELRDAGEGIRDLLADHAGGAVDLAPALIALLQELVAAIETALGEAEAQV
jgi:hypothetical protein